MGWTTDWTTDWSGDWSGDWGADIYVTLDGNDADDGRDWAHAKLTIANALSNVGTGATMYIDTFVGDGDFSAQTSITLDKSVNLKPEHKILGEVAGTVILPPTV